MSLRLYQLLEQPGNGFYSVVVAVELGDGEARNPEAVARACAAVILADPAAASEAALAWEADTDWAESFDSDPDQEPPAVDVQAYLLECQWTPLSLEAGRVVSSRFSDDS